MSANLTTVIEQRADLTTVIEQRLMELLGGSKEPECAACGRKPISPAQMTGALRVALQYLATKAPQTSDQKAGSGFMEDPDDE